MNCFCWICQKMPRAARSTAIFDHFWAVTMGIVHFEFRSQYKASPLHCPFLGQHTAAPQAKNTIVQGRWLTAQNRFICSAVTSRWTAQTATQSRQSSLKSENLDRYRIKQTMPGQGWLPFCGNPPIKHWLGKVNVVNFEVKKRQLKINIDCILFLITKMSFMNLFSTPRCFLTILTVNYFL